MADPRQNNGHGNQARFSGIFTPVITREAHKGEMGLEAESFEKRKPVRFRNS
jgi:hypothetical protein